MHRTDNPELKRKILDHLADMYNIFDHRDPNHLSTFVYCRTKAYLAEKSPAQPTDQEVMLFALGYGLQDVLTPHGYSAPTYTQDGIVYRPDMSFTPAASEVEQLLEVKTTRKSAKYHEGPISETWEVYMKGGCYLRGTTTYDLIVLYMMGNYAPPFPQLYCDTFEFDQGELTTNWLDILQRKAVLDEALRTGIPPTPFENCYAWECKYCRYDMVCQTIVQNLDEKESTQ